MDYVANKGLIKQLSSAYAHSTGADSYAQLSPYRIDRVDYSLSRGGLKAWICIIIFIVLLCLLISIKPSDGQREIETDDEHLESVMTTSQPKYASTLSDSQLKAFLKLEEERLKSIGKKYKKWKQNEEQHMDEMDEDHQKVDELISEKISEEELVEKILVPKRKKFTFTADNSEQLEMGQEPVKEFEKFTETPKTDKDSKQKQRRQHRREFRSPGINDITPKILMHVKGINNKRKRRINEDENEEADESEKEDGDDDDDDNNKEEHHQAAVDTESQPSKATLRTQSEMGKKIPKSQKHLKMLKASIPLTDHETDQELDRISETTTNAPVEFGLEDMIKSKFEKTWIDSRSAYLLIRNKVEEALSEIGSHIKQSIEGVGQQSKKQQVPKDQLTEEMRKGRKKKGKQSIDENVKLSENDASRLKARIIIKDDEIETQRNKEKLKQKTSVIQSTSVKEPKIIKMYKKKGHVEQTTVASSSVDQFDDTTIVSPIKTSSRIKSIPIFVEDNADQRSVIKVFRTKSKLIKTTSPPSPSIITVESSKNTRTIKFFRTKGKPSQKSIEAVIPIIERDVKLKFFRTKRKSSSDKIKPAKQTTDFSETNEHDQIKPCSPTMINNDDSGEVPDCSEIDLKNIEQSIRHPHHHRDHHYQNNLNHMTHESEELKNETEQVVVDFSEQTTPSMDTEITMNKYDSLIKQYNTEPWTTYSRARELDKQLEIKMSKKRLDELKNEYEKVLNFEDLPDDLFVAIVHRLEGQSSRKKGRRKLSVPS